MANNKHKQENTGWTPVPQFGAWDQNTTGDTSYSVIFQKKRDDRKQHKQNISQGVPLSQQRQMMPPPQRQHYGRGTTGTFDSPSRQDDSVAKKKKILTYINCCIRP